MESQRGIVVVVLLAALVVFMFGTSVRQKNELGTVMGFGCGMIILLNVLLNLAGIFGYPADDNIPAVLICWQR